MQKESKYILPEDPEKFLQKILEAFPNDFTTLKKVIGIGSVKYATSESMTAAVSNTKPYTLIFGKPFIEENIYTIEDCVFLLSHELTHLVLDHFAEDIRDLFKEKELGEQATHIIIDCQVNATCYHSLREEKYLEFLKRYYSKTEMPYCFLRPDGEPPTDELRELHNKLYSIDGITNQDLIEGLKEWFESNKDKLKEALKDLLGNHSNIFDEEENRTDNESIEDLTSSYSEDLNNALEEAIKELEEEGNLPKKEGKQDKKGNKPGSSDCLTKRTVQTVLDKIKYSRKLKKQFNKSYLTSPSSRINQALNSFLPKVQTRTPIPNFYDRTTVALDSVGHTPVFHKHRDLGKKVIVPWYIDVSGSQDHVVKYVMNVASRNRRIIGNNLYCFSNKVVPTSLDVFCRGEYYTTGGTDFNPVAKHIIDNNFKNALILTDGMAYMNEEYIEKLRTKGIIIKIGWTISNPWFDPLSKISKDQFFVFDKDSGIGNGYY